jgi:cytochrome c biogenesis protein CcmG/thiol:disulfide interchange protein DsbE
MRPALLARLAVIVAIGLLGASDAKADAELGQTAPALTVKELNGQPFDLAEERGKVTLVNFWATWCEPCRKEIPAIEAIYRRYHDQGLEVIGVSADRPHDRASVKEVAQTISYPAAMLEDAGDNGFGSPTELPVTFVIDRSGVVRSRFTPDQGSLTEESLSNTLIPLLQEKPAAIVSTTDERPSKPARGSFWKHLFGSSN